MKECMPELAHPVAVIFREAVETHSWPHIWKMEHQIVIPKIPAPLSEDDLRNLGLSNYFSKCLEWVLVSWLWPTIEKFLSPDQLGGQKGCGTNHYLARLIDSIYTGLDSDGTAVAAMCVDLS